MPRWQPAVEDAVESSHFTDGGDGAKDLAHAVWAAASKGAPEFRLLYPDGAPLRTKIETIVTQVYGGDGVDFLPAADAAISRYDTLGFGTLPVCMAKTQYSLSHDPSLLGRPTGFRVPVRDVTLRRRGLRDRSMWRDTCDARPQQPSRRRAHRQ
jgi:formate--tetrahydrofolate ligase